jgi:ssDNA thymidine ADP-ribosyltransferase, DarT
MDFTYNEIVFPNKEFALISIIDADWQIEEFSSSIIFREMYPTDDIDFAFCGILNHFGGTLPKTEFASILGFSIIDIPNENIYRDEAEEMVLDELLKGCELFGLIRAKEIEVEQDGKKTRSQSLELTDEGRLALNNKIKFRYWSDRFDNFKSCYHCENAYFDFINYFGLKASLPNKLAVSRFDFQCDAENKFNYQIIDYQLTQASESRFELVTIGNSHKKRSKNQRVQYALFNKFEGYNNLLLVLINDEVQEELTSIINDPRNEDYKNDLVLRCKFKAILDDSNAIFNGQIINEYLGLWDRIKLISDPRVAWSDDVLWTIFNLEFNSNEWRLITEQAPTGILIKRVPEFNTRFNWAILSERLDEEYIFKNLYTEGYRWDFEILSGRDSEFVWRLINEINNHNLGKDKEEKIIANWDFLVITDNLTDEKIELLLPHKYNLDFILLSKKQPEFVLSCLKEISKINSNLQENEDSYKTNWDWRLISENWSLATIWNNIALLEENLDWYIFLKRVFANAPFTEIFLRGDQFKERLLKNKERVRPTFRLESLIWSEQLIDLFIEAEILLWQSNNSQLGFECNPTIEWTSSLFEKYSVFFTTKFGKKYISKFINSWEFVFKVPNFEWDWDELSRNLNLTFSEPTLIKFKDFFNWTILSERIDDQYILNNILDFNWDFSVLSHKKSHKFLETALKKENQTLYKNWDWKHLSQILDNEFIVNNLVIVNEKWDWEYLTREKFSKEEIVELFDTSVEYWDWEYLLTESFSITELTNDSFFILITSCLNLIEEENKRKRFWSIVTERVTPNFLGQNDYENLHLSILKWDWSYLSRHPRFDFTIDFIQQFKGKWDWLILSKNKKINSDKKYLKSFSDMWDWTYISEYSTFIFKNRVFDIEIVNYFKRFIDFRVFSKRKDIIIDQNLINKFQHHNWDFAFLSNTETIKPTQDFLRQYLNKNWDWQILSKRKDLKAENKKEEEDKERFINGLILEFSNKDWDWNYLSTRTDINFTFDFLKNMIDKSWNFYAISHNKIMVWSKELLNLLKDKGIDWSHLSKEGVIQEIDEYYIQTFTKYWDWTLLSRNKKFVLTEKLIGQYSKFWSFAALTQRKEILENPKLVLEYKDETWDWSYISSNSKWHLDENTLLVLQDKLDWDLLSIGERINISVELLKRFEDRWNFTILNEGSSRFTDDTKKVLKKYFEQNPKIKFLLEIEKQYSSWKGYIYHFAHLSNASEIIKQASIKSRNSANQLSDSAGSVVNRRHTAHDFARFYFRPQTPTQFYNENLGKSPSDDYELKTWHYFGNHSKLKFKGHYQKAANMGFPKCPVPIFFTISIRELFEKQFDNCYASNGNMQTNWAMVLPISQILPFFNFNDLYSTLGSTSDGNWQSYINASQQEFLVRDELNLNELQSLRIICQTETDRQALINLIGSENPFANKIVIDRGNVYHNNHNRFDLNIQENSLSISTVFNGVGSTIIKTEDDNCISDVQGEIYLQKPKITEGGKNLKIIFSKPTHYQVWFKDESRREWLLYSSPLLQPKKEAIYAIDIHNDNLQSVDILNCIKSMDKNLINTYSQKVRHYILEQHTLLVMSEFDKHFSNVELPINRNLFRFMLSLHDIGKPKSIELSNKNNQYQYTVEIINNLRETLPFNSSEVDIIIALVSDDPIGLYIQENIGVETAKNKIVTLAKQTNLSTSDFFKLMSIYYQSDTSSYTKDAGGLHFLEHLFIYHNGKKVFDFENHLLKFSPEIELKFNKLHQSIQNEIRDKVY